MQDCYGAEYASNEFHSNVVTSHPLNISACIFVHCFNSKWASVCNPNEQHLQLEVQIRDIVYISVVDCLAGLISIKI